MTLSSSGEIPWHQSYWGVTSEPFHPVLRWPEDRRFVYRSPSWSEALARLQYVADYQFGIALVTGDSGTGKSLLLAETMSMLSQQGYRPLLHVCQESENPARFPFGEPASWEVSHLLSSATGRGQNHLPESRYVLLLDDVHRICRQQNAIEQLIDRALHQRTLGCVILAMNSKLAPELLERIAVYAPLLVPRSAYSLEETSDYLLHRFEQAGGQGEPFDEEAIEAFYRCSQGIPRRLNRLAHECLLLAAFRRLSTIPASMIEELHARLQGPAKSGEGPSPVRAA